MNLGVNHTIRLIDLDESNIIQLAVLARREDNPKQNSKFNGIVPYNSIKTICRILGIDNAS